MTERRTSPRQRSYLGGRIAFNTRASTMDCLVRNFTATGAKLEMSSAVMLPDAFDLAIPCKGIETRARVIWRREEAIGVAFAQPEATADIVSLDVVRRLRACERERDALRARVAELTAGA